MQAGNPHLAMGNLCPPVLGTQKGDASYQTQRFPFEVWEEVRRPERGQLDAQDFHILHILGGNSRNCATGIHNPYWVTVPPSQGPRRAGGDPGSRCPRAPPSLTQGPGAALLDGFVFAPGRVPLQLPQDLFHLGLPRAGPPDREKRAEDAPRRPLRSSPSRSAATDESRRFHAAGPRQPRRHARSHARRVRCAPEPRDAGGWGLLFRAQADLGDPASSKGGGQRLVAGRAPPEDASDPLRVGAMGRGQRGVWVFVPITCPPRGIPASRDPLHPGVLEPKHLHSLNSKQLVTSPCQAEAIQRGQCHMSACRELT